jgi:Uma2 family endonuclease
MASVIPTPATLDDLYKVEGKAELIGGRIVHFMATGRRHNRIAGKIYQSLDAYAAQVGRGEAYTDNIGFALPAPLTNGRESFSPDASYHLGPFSDDDRDFADGAPTFAVEVRSKNDYGPSAELEIAEKRADYFAAGTLAVWDVDPDAETIALYTPADPANPTVFRRGDVAHAEPAVPGWRLSVGDLFDAAAN